LFLVIAFISNVGDIWANSPTNHADSLLLVLKQSKKNQAETLNSLAEYYLSNNDSQSFKFANRAIEVSEKAKDKRQLYRAYLSLGTYYRQKRNFEKANLNLDKALQLSKNPYDKSVVFIQLAVISIEDEKNRLALDYLSQVRTFLYENPNQELMYQYYLYEGLCYFQSEDYQIATFCWNKALDLAKATDNKIKLARVYDYLGRASFVSNDYLSGYSFYQRALENLHTDSVSEVYASTLNHIGDIYKIQGNFKSATFFYQSALSAYSRLDVEIGKGDCYTSLGKLQLEQDHYTEALNYFNLAKEIFNRLNYYRGLSEVYNQLGILLRMKQDYNLATDCFNQATRYSKWTLSENQLFKTYIEISRLYLDEHKFDSALIAAHSAMNYGNNSGDLSNLSKFYDVLSEIYYQQGDFKKAYENYKKATIYKDSVQLLINKKEIKFLQAKHETERQQNVISVLTHEKKVKDETINFTQRMLQKQKGYIALGVIVLVLLGVIALILATWLNQKRKSNNYLLIKNKQIAQQNEEIEVQRQHLLEVNSELEKLSIVARETDNAIKIMNPTGKVLWINEGFTKMYGYTLEEIQMTKNINLFGFNVKANVNELVNVWFGDKQPITYETQQKRKDGQDLWVQTTLNPILDGEDKIEKMIAIDTDITKIKKAEEEIMLKNLDITSSISYAKRIQEAMISPFSTLTDHYPNSFCFYQPKSIVSGDFYWISFQHERLIVVCADSTGHGVPGAFMSLIGISFLNKIVNEKGFITPSIILNRLRMNIINHLHQGENVLVADDGMDISVISIDKKNHQLEYAGAMNPIYILRKQEFIELKADRMPVGFFDNETKPFSGITLQLEPNDQIFMFTDGYYDQFGGEAGEKMKMVIFKNLLSQCYLKNADEQKEIIEGEFNKWKGDQPQIDDILIMGITIN